MVCLLGVMSKSGQTHRKMSCVIALVGVLFSATSDDGLTTLCEQETHLPNLADVPHKVCPNGHLPISNCSVSFDPSCHTHLFWVSTPVMYHYLSPASRNRLAVYRLHMCCRQKDT